MADDPMTELEARRWLKQVKEEYAAMEAEYIEDPTLQNKFDLTIKVFELRCAEAKVKNLKRDAKKLTGSVLE